MTGVEKYIEIEAGGNKYKVWTKKFGDNPKVKILLLHGGPGATYHTFEIMAPYFEKEGYEFYYYDQLGSYLSDDPKDSSLWVIDRFVDEVEQVRQALGLTHENFFLLGTSWGGILAMEYALKHQDHIKGLVVQSIQASAEDYTRYGREVLGNKIGEDFVDQVAALEAAGDYGEAFDALMLPYYENFVIRCPQAEWPDPLLKMVKLMNRDLYVHMNGNSEFGCTGTLKDWDIKSRLHQIRVPTLVIGAEYNTMDPDQMRWMADEMEKGEYLHCPEGSHLCHWDDHGHFYPGLIEFIKRLDTV